MELRLKGMSRAGTLLTIAGFDPSSGAGVTADLNVFAAHGRFGTACITALTVQSTLGVRAVHAVDAGILAASLACLEEDLPAAGIKVGMLATEANVLAVATLLERRPPDAGPVVLDPVLRSTSGRELLNAAGLKALRTRLLARVAWVTPNLAELGALVGRALAPGDAEAAARDLAERHPGLGVVVTGGDGEAADDLVLTPAGEATWLRADKIASRATHGTGCAFSSALLCGLVGGKPGLDAARAAKLYVAEAIRRAHPRGHGLGPMHLLWPFDPA